MGRLLISNGSVIQLWIPSQRPFVAIVPFYPHKSPRSKWGRKTCHPYINSQPKCHAKSQCWSFVTVPLFAGGDPEAQNGAMTSISLQSQREAPGGVTGSAPIPVALHLDLLPGAQMLCSREDKHQESPAATFSKLGCFQAGFPLQREPQGHSPWSGEPGRK